MRVPLPHYAIVIIADIISYDKNVLQKLWYIRRNGCEEGEKEKMTDKKKLDDFYVLLDVENVW